MSLYFEEYLYILLLIVYRDLNGFDVNDAKLYIRIMSSGEIVGTATIPLLDVKDRASEYSSKL